MIVGAKSKRKGKTGELEAAKAWQAATDVAMRRTQQFCGTDGDADIVSVDGSLDGLHLEVKRCESFRLWSSLEQAKADSKDGSVPVVLHRRNGCPWVVVLYLSDVVRFSDVIHLSDVVRFSEELQSRRET